MKTLKSSHKIFWDTIEKLGYDNSTGDLNYLLFWFIDGYKLQQEFKEFMEGYAKQEIEAREDNS